MGRRSGNEKDDFEMNQETVEDIRESKSKVYRIRNAACRNRTVYGITGRPVVFDSEGIATVESADYDHFGRVPGYERL